MKKTTAFALFIALCTLSVSAYSMVGLNLKKIKPLTEVEILPEEQFDASTNLIKETPYDDEFLYYQLRPTNRMER